MRLLKSALIISFLIISCGKNDAITPTGVTPQYPQNTPNYQQAPAPQGYYPQQGGGNYGPNQFVPQMPSGYSQGYYPFLPVYQYMQNRPQYQNFWNQTWYGWQSYANSNGYNQNDFNTFWFDYCPQQWGNSGQSQLYQYFDQNFYWWVTPETQFPSSVDAGYYWQNYTGYQYDYCNTGFCY